MDTRSADTETVVRRHLQAFVEQQGLDAILHDYADDARFLTEATVYCGKPGIRQFFVDFMASLPPNAIDEFSLHALRAEGDVAYITWSAGRELPLGTDTFVVRDGRIVSQTFAAFRAGRG
ncbi:MAG: nuclear transport factor 2 family protein [Burkholderiales bacterium]